MSRLCIVLVLLVGMYLPLSTAAAETSTNQAELYEAIRILQNQIAVLEAALQKAQTAQLFPPVQTAPLTTASISSYQPTKTLARYEKNAANEWRVSNQVHYRYISELLATWPAAYAAKLQTIVIFDESQSPYDAFVVAQGGQRTEWLYGVGDELVYEPDSVANHELMIHELGHVVAYDQVEKGQVLAQNSVCGEYFSKADCPAVDSYLTQFVHEFWSPEQLVWAEKQQQTTAREAAAYEYFLANPGEFVNDYAAQSPTEDFAESFMYFMLDMPVTCRDCRAAQKKQWFAKHPELMSMRDSLVFD